VVRRLLTDRMARPRVLIVDDNSDERTAVASVLQADFDVSLDAAAGALRRIEQGQRFCALVLDRAHRSIRPLIAASNELMGRRILVMATELGDLEPHEQARALQKPFSRDDFRRKLSALLGCNCARVMAPRDEVRHG
jgi:CheY-like chemotaxis protein